MKRIKKGFVVPCLVLLLAPVIFGQLRLARPESVAVSSAGLARMDALIAEDIANKRLPGAVVLVGRKGQSIWRKAYGDRAVEPAR